RRWSGSASRTCASISYKLSFDKINQNAPNSVAPRPIIQITQRAEPMNVISVTKDKDGVFTIAPIALKEKDKSGLRELGIKVDGTVEVRLPSNAQVISHNASGTPGMFSKAYTWKVGAIDQNPYIKFKLAS
ncbi:hypothetical protein V8923_23380, partial [Ralstonia mannitolilytica]